MPAVFALADRISVLVYGRVIASGDPAAIRANEDVKRCLVRYWTYYAYGAASWEQDACTYNAVQAEAAQNGFALKNVLTGVVHAPRFTRRAGDQSP